MMIDDKIKREIISLKQNEQNLAKTILKSLSKNITNRNKGIDELTKVFKTVDVSTDELVITLILRLRFTKNKKMPPIIKVFERRRFYI